MTFQKRIKHLEIFFLGGKGPKNMTQDPNSRSNEGIRKGRRTYVSANGNEAKVKGSSKVTNVFEGRAMRVDVLFIVVIDTFR